MRKKHIDFGREEFKDPGFEKKNKQVNPSYYEGSDTRHIDHENVPLQFNSFLSERKEVLHNLWDEIGIDWRYRENFIDKNFSVSQNKRYNFIADETLRLYGFIKTDNVIKGLILHREKLLQKFENLQGGGTIKTLDVHRRKFVLSLIQTYRTYTLYIIEHLKAWSKQKDGDFEWSGSGEDIILKMNEDFTRICQKNHCLSLVMDFYDYSSTTFAVPNNKSWYFQKNRDQESEKKEFVEFEDESFFVTQPKPDLGSRKEELPKKKKKKAFFDQYQPLKNIIKLPPLLLPLKYQDIKKKSKQYSHLLIKLRVKDILGQQNPSAFESKKHYAKHSAIRQTNRVLHQLKSKRHHGETPEEYAQRKKKLRLTSKKKMSASLYRRKMNEKKHTELLKRTKFLAPNLQKEYTRIQKAEIFLKNYLEKHHRGSHGGMFPLKDK